MLFISKGLSREIYISQNVDSITGDRYRGNTQHNEGDPQQEDTDTKDDTRWGTETIPKIFGT